jgi:hypothetical protein
MPTIGEINTRFENTNDLIEDFNEAAADPSDEENLKYLLIHAQFGRYSVDFKKCDDGNCCTPINCKDLSDKLVPFGGFFPTIVPDGAGRFTRLASLLSHPPQDSTDFTKPDMYMPSLSSEYSTFLCAECNKYFPVKKLLASHKKFQHPRRVIV